MSLDNETRDNIIETVTRINKTIDIISWIGAIILFGVLSYLNWSELLEKKTWPTTYSDFIECIIVPMVTLTFLFEFILEIREERAYKKAIKNNQPYPLNNKFYNVARCFIIAYGVLFAMITSYANSDTIFCLSIQIGMIVMFWVVSILHYFRINIHNFLKHNGWNKIDKALYKNIFDSITNNDEATKTTPKTTTKVYHNYIFPRITLLLIAVITGLFGYIAWNEYHSIYGTPDDDVYLEIICYPLLSIAALVAAILFNRIKISKSKTLLDLYNKPDNQRICFGIFTFTLVCIILLISDGYTMRTTAFQSVEYLYMAIAFWIWGLLSCFIANIHQFLQRKGWNRLDRFIHEITFTKYKNKEQ